MFRLVLRPRGVKYYVVTGFQPQKTAPAKTFDVGSKQLNDNVSDTDERKKKKKNRHYIVTIATQYQVQAMVVEK